MLGFFQTYMCTEKVRKVVIAATVERILEFSEGGRNVIHSEMDTFPVTEMLDHINYMKKDETEILIDTFMFLRR